MVYSRVGEEGALDQGGNQRRRVFPFQTRHSTRTLGASVKPLCASRACHIPPARDACPPCSPASADNKERSRDRRHMMDDDMLMAQAQLTKASH
jgi:hypothetical protein